MVAVIVCDSTSKYTECGVLYTYCGRHGSLAVQFFFGQKQDALVQGGHRMRHIGTGFGGALRRGKWCIIHVAFTHTEGQGGARLLKGGGVETGLDRGRMP